jgi:hypothetical protein
MRTSDRRVTEPAPSRTIATTRPTPTPTNSGTTPTSNSPPLSTLDGHAGRNSTGTAIMAMIDTSKPMSIMR